MNKVIYLFPNKEIVALDDKMKPIGELKFAVMPNGSVMTEEQYKKRQEIERSGKERL